MIGKLTLVICSAYLFSVVWLFSMDGNVFLSQKRFLYPNSKQLSYNDLFRYCNNHPNANYDRNEV